MEPDTAVIGPRIQSRPDPQVGDRLHEPAAIPANDQTRGRTEIPGGRDIVFVDLDGTLIRTDMFAEGVLRLLKRNPLNIFLVFLWLLRGRSVAKMLVARRSPIDPATLPYETGVVDYLKARKAEGAEIVMATAAHWSQARPIARHLGLFDAVLASSARRNLKGRRKLEAIRHYAGERTFSYAGDTHADHPIWAAAERCILVNAPRREVAHWRSAGKVERMFSSQNTRGRAFLKEMRLHQWAKNVLVFVPLLTSHKYGDFGLGLDALMAFVVFSLCASGVYFLNDLLDLDADRVHPTKCNRPLASGALPVSYGILGAVGFPIISFAIAALTLPLEFLVVLAGYFAITNLYSFFLKKVSTADVMTLAVLYTIRVIAGAVACSIVLSSWLLGFSIFVFVSLAYLKRYVEVAALEGKTAKGRGYTGNDSETMFSLGTANATASVLVLALYINSDDVRSLYTSPQILWLLCLLHLYWSNRIWVGARRGKIHDDPIVFALKDNVSRMVWLAFVVVVLAAQYIAL